MIKTKPYMYRWQSANDWLADKVESWNEDTLRACLKALSTVLKPDVIEDLFKNEMYADGFFDLLPEFVPSCDHTWMEV